MNTVNDLIYLIYTSGTTGKPKGVMVEHKSVTRLVHRPNYVELNKDTVILQTGSLSFDAATFEIWGALLNGGELQIGSHDVIMDTATLKQTIAKHKINTMFLTTALFNQLINSDVTVFDGIGTLLFGGEKTSELHVRKLLENNAHIQLTNVYGPTETTTFATYYSIDVDQLRAKTPIGKPISNTATYIMNEGRLCGIGMVGELCIAGDGVARGYLNKPELTKAKFIPNSYGSGMMYCSGDLARWLPDGNIEYLGRIDDQVK
ncbi:AMP-binding protein, partial [Bacillus atrophaeus]|uniref:AMP-binding protein n=1 Tax=Bacillus atrophaeus TaxID=1452 RepID=UPI002280AE43